MSIDDYFFQCKMSVSTRSVKQRMGIEDMTHMEPNVIILETIQGVIAQEISKRRECGKYIKPRDRGSYRKSRAQG